jgi:DNA polymerase II large subunit
MTIIDDAHSCLRNLTLPEYYANYQESLLKNVQRNLDVSMKARKIGLDVSDKVEPKIAFDLADRVAKMHDIDIAGIPQRRRQLSKLLKKLH